MKEPGTWPPSCFSSSCQAGWKAEPREHLPEPVCNDEKEDDNDDADDNDNNIMIQEPKPVIPSHLSAEVSFHF